MDSIIPSNLIDQLIEMSTVSEMSKFLIIHLNFLSVLTILSFFLLFFLVMITSTSNYEYLFSSKTMFVTLSLFIILSITTIIVSSGWGDLKESDLSKSQMTLVKSIPSPIFQNLVKDAIRENGATISSIETAVKKFKHDKTEKGMKGIEFYNSVDPK